MPDLQPFQVFCSVFQFELSDVCHFLQHHDSSLQSLSVILLSLLLISCVIPEKIVFSIKQSPKGYTYSYPSPVHCVVLLLLVQALPFFSHFLYYLLYFYGEINKYNTDCIVCTLQPTLVLF